MLIKQHMEVPLQLKSVSDTGEFEGYGAVFGVKDSYDDIVVPGAFVKSLNGWRARGALPALLWQHQMHEPIGVYTDMREDDTGLFVKGRLLIDDDPLAKRAHAHMKAGSLTGLSIGYVLREREHDRHKAAWILKEIDLWEVSPVTFPASDAARISHVKSGDETPSPDNTERILRDAGFSRRQARALMAGGYDSLFPAAAAEVSAAINILKSIKF